MTSSSMIKTIKETVIDNATLLGFEYKGKEGNVDPYYSNGKNHFLLFFDGQEQVVESINDVFSTAFIMGHTLCEIAEDIVVTDY